ncbi:MAG: lamin tail domain-containing protein [Candidatus Marinimicrobia bacterium]|nr:lamin tail domain-containing protein [Candidatus Neomarinimicrobiota bacterium]
MTKYRIIGLLLFLSQCMAQSNHTFMTYNLLNYQDDNNREVDYITIIEYVEPDIIIAEEVIGQRGYDHFLSDVLDIVEADAWSGASFINQSAGIDIALYYRHDVFSFVSTSLVNTAPSGLRDVVEWVMEHNESGVRFNVYGVHLKAGTGNDDALQRLAEVTILRDYLDDLPAGSHFMVAGDFNIYSSSSSSEPAFDMLTGVSDDNDGRLFDPVDRIGNWHADTWETDCEFADVHTQSPRITQFGGGAPGGMDDRFDWIFVSEAVLNETYEINYVEDTYWAVGNDGNHCNQAINDGNNTSVNDAMADALHDASDHLPVIATFAFPGGDPSPYNIVITEVMVNPAVVSDTYGEWFEIYNHDSISINLAGWQIADSDNDHHEIQTVSIEFYIHPGEYVVLGRNGDSNVNGGYTADYEYSGFLLANLADEIMLIDDEGRIADKVVYKSSFPYSSGVSMYLKNINYDNNTDTSWAMSDIVYGAGDFGTPGRAWNDTTTAGVDHDNLIPKGFVLYPAYPNPFNPTTTIRFSVVETLHTTSLHIFDLTGRLVETLVDENLQPGTHEIIWNASSQPSGVYFIQLTNGSKQQTQKVILLK